MANEREEYGTIEGLEDAFGMLDSNHADASEPVEDFAHAAAEEDDDPRLKSGVPEEARADELDFIEMTGLTRPAASPSDPVDPVDSSPQPESGAGSTDDTPPGPEPEPAPAPESEPGLEAGTEPLPPRMPAVEAADALDDADADDDSADDVVARALEALAAVPPAAPPPQAAPDDVDNLVSKVRDEILDGIREDLSALRPPAEAPTAPSAEPVVEAGAEPESGLEAGEAEEAHEAPSAPPPESKPSLEEAERLVQELQQQPRDHDPSTKDEPPPATPLPADAPVKYDRRHGERRSLSRLYAERHRDVQGYLAAYTGEPAKPQSDEPDVEVDFANDPPKHRHRSLTKKQRAMRRFLIIAFLLVFVASAGYIAYQYAEPYLQTATTLYREAEQLEVAGKAREASNRYRAFLTRYPNDPRAPEALFRAGFVLQVEDGARVSARALADSVSLFESFIEEYPDHDKVHRARTLRGILLHRMDNHEQAVTVLRDPSLHLADPAAALPVWRTLAAAHEAMGDMEAARSEYLKAASYQGNYSADEDYEMLAKMYRRLAEREPGTDERAALLEESLEFFQQASLVAGISRDRLQSLRREMEFLRREIEDIRVATDGAAAEPAVTPPVWDLLEREGDPTEPAIEPGEALSVLDGLDASLPGAGLHDDAVDDAAGDEGAPPVAPGVSPDPVFDDSTDESGTAEHALPDAEGEMGLPDEMAVLNEGEGSGS